MQRPDDNGFLRGGPPQDYLERNIYSSYAQYTTIQGSSCNLPECLGTSPATPNIPVRAQ
jgi:hypothetical protein